MSEKTGPDKFIKRGVNYLQAIILIFLITGALLRAQWEIETAEGERDEEAATREKQVDALKLKFDADNVKRVQMAKDIAIINEKIIFINSNTADIKKKSDKIYDLLIQEKIKNNR